MVLLQANKLCFSCYEEAVYCYMVFAPLVFYADQNGRLAAVCDAFSSSLSSGTARLSHVCLLCRG